MALGMTYEEYWYGDVLKARAFLRADRERQKRVNENAWLFGVYVFRALNATVGNLFLKDGAEPITYPTEPIDLDGSKSEEKAAQEQENERKRLIAHLNAIALNMRNQQ